VPISVEAALDAWSRGTISAGEVLGDNLTSGEHLAVGGRCDLRARRILHVVGDCSGRSEAREVDCGHLKGVRTRRRGVEQGA
jgi:hypothetical protein